MSALPKKKMTEAEYLEIERDAEFKSEFYNGEMFPMHGSEGPYGMAGAKYEHNRVKENLSIAIGGALKGSSCQSLSSDMKVKVQATGLNTYPDNLIVCGEPIFTDEKKEVLLNPTVLIEVLSPRTETYDRSTKLRHYQLIPTLMGVHPRCTG